jgi:hypothetical protein
VSGCGVPGPLPRPGGHHPPAQRRAGRTGFAPPPPPRGTRTPPRPDFPRPGCLLTRAARGLLDQDGGGGGPGGARESGRPGGRGSSQSNRRGAPQASMAASRRPCAPPSPPRSPSGGGRGALPGAGDLTVTTLELAGLRPVFTLQVQGASRY